MCLSVKGARGVGFHFQHFSFYLEAHLRRDISLLDIKVHPVRDQVGSQVSVSNSGFYVWIGVESPAWDFRLKWIFPHPLRT